MKNLLSALIMGLMLVVSVSAKEQTETIEIPTMVCKMCVKTITKAVEKVDGVTKVTVDKDKKNAVVTFDDEKTSVEKVENAISEAGYSTTSKKRNQESYNKLAKCCKIDG